MSYANEQDIELLRSKEYLLQRNITLISDFEEDCWLWHGSTDRQGYAYITLKVSLGKQIKVAAHRMSYLLYVGPIPEGILCLHKCDEPRCCNPAHLFLGTKKDNAQDMDEKGRRVNYWIGKAFSEETRNKMSESQKKRYSK
jgi:hypothetical protein